MKFRYSNEYLNEISDFSHTLKLDHLQGKTLALSGATGQIGSYLIDTLLSNPRFEVKIIALVRDIPRAQERFLHYSGDTRLHLIKTDLNNIISLDSAVDYVLHAASATSPHEYAAQPIETMMVNFLGTKNMLDLAAKNNARFLFVSSTEIYGQSDGKRLSEAYSGYLDPLDVRSSYNEAKRASETLTISYAKEHGLAVVIPRLSRVYGPTLKNSDRKAMTQFLMAAHNKQPIVLKSAGTQIFSYLYVADAVAALVFLLDRGLPGQAYNVAGEEIFMLKEIAEMIGAMSGVSITFDLAEEPGVSYSKTTHAVLDITKIKNLGWSPQISLFAGLARTLAQWASFQS